jgi:uncharacterized protein (DUF1778 family)
MSETSTKTARVDFRIAAEQKETIEKAAAISGLNLSDFIISTSLARATEVLHERTRITLSERDWQQFVESLEEDRDPTEAMKKAAERYNSGRREGARYHW